MKITVRPTADPRREIDVTRRLVTAVAEELWRCFGGNDRLNWLEAERHVQGIAGMGAAVSGRGRVRWPGRARRHDGGRAATGRGTSLAA